jgi:carbonic anhydrase
MDMKRRSFLKGSAAASGLALAAGAFSVPEAWAAPRPDGRIVTPADALMYLREGNARWASGDTQRKTYAPPGQSPEAGQWPFAAIVSCSDSRVVPEDMFDVAGKNLFIIRNAGNVVDDVTMGSLEYAVEHTGIALIVALGHTNCGAVKATQGSLETGTMPGGFVDAIVERISPAVVALPADHTLDEAIAANAAQSAQQIQDRSPIIAAATDAGTSPATVGIVRAVYGLSSRVVTFF